MSNLITFHWISVILVLAIPVAILVVIARIVRRAPPSTTGKASVESRLRELDSLKSKGLITDSEYEVQRSSIVSGV